MTAAWRPSPPGRGEARAPDRPAPRTGRPLGRSAACGREPRARARGGATRGFAAGCGGRRDRRTRARAAAWRARTSTRRSRATARCTTPSRHAIAREELERVERAIAALPEAQQEVVVLARIAGLSRRAIAAELGRSEEAVRMLLHRGLAKVADVLARDG
ncbi:MAG TPA: sigma-70 family RNA polymerase sigma factor [Planctomycetota bacterium]|nr:sigma-70 family RNA polymerase sigma factor [Planctomycetota bacterium]